jgi:hypothetical protein
MSYITLLDPSLMDHELRPSTNLGDVIIYNSVRKILDELFPKMEIIRIASHVPLLKKHFEIIRKSEFTFVGGTNIFTSDIVNGFRLLPIKKEGNLNWLFPGLRNLIFLGVGWGIGYNSPINLKTRIYYRRLLSKKFIHSARDSYSANKMNGIIEVCNTSCPTMWTLNQYEVNRKENNTQCLLTLTDYHQDIDLDTQLIKMCLDNFSTITFFPQGIDDLKYLSSLEIYKSNRDKFNLLPHNIELYYNFVMNEKFTFVGTRLHGGILCMQMRKDAIIVGIDNRATEMGKDTGLPVIKRNEFSLLQKWFNKEPIYSPIQLPVNNIQNWRRQFQ